MGEVIEGAYLYSSFIGLEKVSNLCLSECYDRVRIGFGTFLALSGQGKDKVRKILGHHDYGWDYHFKNEILRNVQLHNWHNGNQHNGSLGYENNPENDGLALMYLTKLI